MKRRGFLGLASCLPVAFAGYKITGFVEDPWADVDTSKPRPERVNGNGLLFDGTTTETDLCQELTPEQADRFLDLVLKESVLTDNVFISKMRVVKFRELS